MRSDHHPTRAVVFDLDDTLYRERRFLVSGLAHVATSLEEQEGVPMHRSFRVLVGAVRRGRRRSAFQELCDDLGWPHDRVPRLIELFRHHRPRLSLPRQSRDVLDRLRPTWRLGVLTNGLVGVQRRKVEALGLAGVTDAVVYAGACGVEKPARRSFEEIRLRLGVAARAIVFVGDDLWCDVQGARAAGFIAVHLCRSPWRRSAWPLRPPHARIRSLRELPALAPQLLEAFRNAA